MTRSIAAVGILVLAAFTAACSGAAPAGSQPATGQPASSGQPASTAGTGTPAGTAPAPAASAPAAGQTDAAGFPVKLTVAELCAALTAEEMSEIFGEPVTIDPSETEWCGYDLEDGSGMLLVPFGGDETPDEFIEGAETFGCTAKTVDVGGGALSSCGADQEEGRPSEAWFLLNGVGVQLSVDVEATEEQYLEMMRQALD